MIDIGWLNSIDHPSTYRYEIWETCCHFNEYYTKQYCCCMSFVIISMMPPHMWNNFGVVGYWISRVISHIAFAFHHNQSIVGTGLHIEGNSGKYTRSKRHPTLGCSSMLLVDLPPAPDPGANKPPQGDHEQLRQRRTIGGRWQQQQWQRAGIHQAHYAVRLC